MNWRPLLIAGAIINALSLISLIVFSFVWRYLHFDLSIVFAILGINLVTLPAILIPAFQRRMARGSSRRFGIGVGIVDVIEGISGKQLSNETAMKIRWITVGIAVLLLVIGVALTYARGGGFGQ